jgi:MoxR-like ATPase/Mg-chelatase subunit ChlD
VQAADLRRIQEGIRSRVVGRVEDTQLLLAALGAGRDLLLEGPPGTSKSTILRAVADLSGSTLHFIEGNADLTPSKLVGHHSPSRVLQEGYSPDNFTHGPLPLAMAEGGILYIEEFNRVPEDTLNALLTAMAERELTIPRAGSVRAAPGFRIVAAMNPFDNAGTAQLGSAITDRLCRVVLDYQPEPEEREIVARRTDSSDAWLIRLAVRTARLTRRHPDLRMGASLRAAIDFVLVAEQLAILRDVTLSRAPEDEQARRTLVGAAQTTFSVKMVVREAARRTADEVVEEVVNAALTNPPPPDEVPGHSEAESDEAGDETSPESGEEEGQPRRSSRDGTGAHGSPGEESERAKVAVVPYGSSGRSYAAFAREHPELAEQLRRGESGLGALEEALEQQPGDRLELLGKMTELHDHADLRDLARRLARKILVREARQSLAGRSGRGRLVSVPYAGQAAELDLDRSLERLLSTPHPSDKDLNVFDRRHHRRAYALILDISGSMEGPALFHAALALSTFAVRVAPDPFAIVAFWREMSVLKRLHEEVFLDMLLDRMFSLAAQGLTDVGLGLRAGLEELESADAQERVGLLFSDGMQTAGEPAEPIAATFPLLHVVATGRGEESRTRCRRLADLGGGRCAVIETASGIPDAINYCLAA